MSYPPPPPPLQFPPPKPRGRRRGCLAAAGILGGLILVIIIIAVAVAAISSGGKSGHPAAVGTTPAPAVATSQAPAAPNPSGTYSGSCDYTLSTSLYGADHLIGEVDVVNNGNIGTKDRVRITWPQEGYSPVAATRNVKTTPGQHLAVRFHLPASQTVISQLQSW